jgi:hypothetical protein
MFVYRVSFLQLPFPQVRSGEQGSERKLTLMNSIEKCTQTQVFFFFLSFSVFTLSLVKGLFLRVLKRPFPNLGTVAHTNNFSTSYLGNRDQEAYGSRVAWAKDLGRLHLIKQARHSQACDPSYMGGRDMIEVRGRRGQKSRRPYLKV